jgi:hypothetical protein
MSIRTIYGLLDEHPVCGGLGDFFGVQKCRWWYARVAHCLGWSIIGVDGPCADYVAAIVERLSDNDVDCVLIRH